MATILTLDRVMLDRVTIRGFKSIRALDDFPLRALNVLIGANGAGKSNFIAFFELLARMSERRLDYFVEEHDGPDALLVRRPQTNSPYRDEADRRRELVRVFAGTDGAPVHAGEPDDMVRTS